MIDNAAYRQSRITFLRLLPYAIVAILGSAYLVAIYASSSPLFGAALGPIDDHEYVRYIRHGGDSPLHIPSLLRDTTEVGSWGDSTRFRPAYYLLRVSGIYTLGENGGLRYLIRVAAHLATSLALAYALVRLVFPKLGSLRLSIATIVLSMAFFAVPNWLDVTPRLGPSELALNLALAALILIVVHSSINGHVTGRVFVVAVVASLLASGSKESAIWAPILLYPVFHLYIRDLPRGSARRISAWFAFISAATFQLWISVGVAISLGNSGEDVYGAGISLRDVPSLSIAGVREALTLPTILLVILMLSLRWVNPSKGARVGQVYFDRILVVTFSIIGVTTIDYVFYRGVFEVPRYGLTTSLLGTFVSGLLVLSLARMWSTSRYRIDDSRGIVAALVVSAITLTAIFALSPTQDPYTALATLHQQSVVVRENSLGWQRQLDQAAALEDVQSADGILLHVTDLGRFEVTYALRHFLALDFPEKPFFLVADFSDESAEERLVGILEQVSAGNVAAWEIQPLPVMSTIDKLACMSTDPDRAMLAYPCVVTVGY